MEALLCPDDIARLRAALTAARYTSRDIADRVGSPAVDPAVEAVRCGDLRALLRATTDRDRLATLIRLFLAGQTELADAVEAALAPLPVPTALAAGLVEAYGDGVHAGVDLDVYTGHTGVDWWVLSDVDVDVRPGPLRTDHVLGVGNTATTLAGSTIRQPARRALVQEADHDGADWTVDRQVLRQTQRLNWSQEVDPVALALISGADGTLRVREQIALLAAAFDTPEPVLAAMSAPVVAQLVQRGFLLPVTERG